jgi:mycofactocin precursor
MSDSSARVESATLTPERVEIDDLDIDDVEEALIEEISIDGMCGVY